MLDANSRMVEQRDRIEKKLKQKQGTEVDHNENKRNDDDIVTMDGNSIYSKVGHNLKQAKNFNKTKAFGTRKTSILDDFEAIANDSHEEILQRTSSLKQ